jgi:hypothetical protein
VRVLLFFLCIVGFLFRLWGIPHDLPDYSIDENEIVEPAIVCLHGDWRPTLIAYGPLNQYLLAPLYGLSFLILRAIDRSSDWTSFLQQIFFHPELFYLVARGWCALLTSLSIPLVYHLGRRFFDEKTGLGAALLMTFPLEDLFLGKTIRSEGLLTTLSLLTLLQLHTLWKRPTAPYAFCAGAATASALATKHAALLLMAPWVVILCANADLRRKKILLSGLLGALIAFALCNPYAFLEPSHYLHATASHLIHGSDSAKRMGVRGYHLAHIFQSAHLGLPLLVFSLMGLFLFLLTHKQEDRILSSLPLAFFAAFSFSAIRNYWYLPILPLLVLSTTRMCTWCQSIIQAPSRQAIPYLLLLAAWQQPITHLIRESPKWNRSSTSVAARHWIEHHLPSHSVILLIGYYTISPRILSEDSVQQEVLGEYTAWGRHQSRIYRQAYFTAYEREISLGRPAFHLLNVPEPARPPESAMVYRAPPSLWNDRRLLWDLPLSRLTPSHLRDKGIEYVVISSDGRLPWEADLDLLKIFSNERDKMRGEDIRILSVPRPHTPS